MSLSTYHAEVDVIEIVDDDDAPNGLNPLDEDSDSVSVTEPDLSDMQVPGCQLPPQIILLNLAPNVDLLNNNHGSEEVE